MALVSRTTTLQGFVTTNGVTSLWPAKVSIHQRDQRTLGNYYSLIRSGSWLPPLYYLITRELEVKPFGGFEQFYRPTRQRQIVTSGVVDQFVQGLGLPGAPALLTVTAAEYDSVLRRLNAKIFSKIKNESINLAQTWAERKQTISMLESTLKRMIGIARAVRRGDWYGAMNALGLPTGTRRAQRNRAKFGAYWKVSPQQAFANFWLEYNYGWKPFISDIYGAMDAFRKPFPQPLVRVSAWAKLERRLVTTTKPTNWATHTHFQELIQKLGYIIYWRLGDNASANFQRTAAQIGMTNPALLAWELMPYSFVVDWFLPIGNYLSSLDATYGTVFHSGVRIDRPTKFSQTDTSATGEGGGYATQWVTGGCTAIRSYDGFERTVLSAYPVPMLPSLKDPLGVSHALSAFSLLQQIFRF